MSPCRQEAQLHRQSVAATLSKYGEIPPPREKRYRRFAKTDRKKNVASICYHPIMYKFIKSSIVNPEQQIFITLWNWQFLSHSVSINKLMSQYAIYILWAEEKPCRLNEENRNVFLSTFKPKYHTDMSGINLRWLIALQQISVQVELLYKPPINSLWLPTLKSNSI